jgi:hypothetical protein
MRLLPILKGNTVGEERRRHFFNPRDFSEVTPVEKSRVRVSDLHRDGLGLPVIGRISQSEKLDPNVPSFGFIVAATALVLPGSNGNMALFFADPTRVETIEAFGENIPVAMNLEAWLDAAEATGPRFGAGLRYMLRSNRFEYPSHLIFLQPFDPDKTPVVLIHGLMSTPRMWKPVLAGLLAYPENSRTLSVLVLLLPDWTACSVLRSAAPASANGCCWASPPAETVCLGWT